MFGDDWVQPIERVGDSHSMRICDLLEIIVVMQLVLCAFAIHNLHP